MTIHLRDEAAHRAEEKGHPHGDVSTLKRESGAYKSGFFSTISYRFFPFQGMRQAKKRSLISEVSKSKYYAKDTQNRIPSGDRSSSTNSTRPQRVPQALPKSAGQFRLTEGWA